MKDIEVTITVIYSRNYITNYSLLRPIFHALIPVFMYRIYSVHLYKTLAYCLALFFPGKTNYTTQDIQYITVTVIITAMKTRINNKLYNTDTGRYICSSPRGYLYRKYHSIEHFLHDPQRKTITPITWDEAQEIARSNAPREMYNSMFVPRLHYGRSNIDLPLEHYDKLRDIAARHKRSMKKELQFIIDKEYRNRDRHKRL